MRYDLTRRAVLGALGTAAATSGLGTVTADDIQCSDSTHRSAPAPGPDVLYEEPASAPRLAPDGDWTADPLLVSGGEAYVDGEYLYQGWAYDDHGAVTTGGTLTEQPLVTEIDAPEGDLVYPTDADRYRHNAADVLEVRVRPIDGGVRYRVVLNTMVDPDAAVVALGIDTGTGGRTDWGHGLGELGAGVDHVLVTWGTGAKLDGEPLDDETFSVDVDRNRLEVELPLNPDEETWTHYGVAGVHDGDGGFAAVGAKPSDTNPGGAVVTDVPPVFDVAFRTHDDEPLRQPFSESAVSLPVEDPVTGELLDVGVSWREKAQARALADRDISRFGTDVDFGELRDGTVDRRIPTSGYLNRLYVSRRDLGSGIAANETLPSGRIPDVDGSATALLGRVQPYSVYVPESYEPGEPAPLHVLLHSLSFNYNQYAGSPELLRQLGEERDAIVLMPQGRGPAGWWKDEAELDVFEAMADLTARYDVDFDRVTLGGYSMGGYGTYRIGSLYPDLFARGFAVVGPADEDVFGGPSNGEAQLGVPGYTDDPQNTMRVTDNLRHVPLLLWAGTNDELVPYPGVRNYRRQLADHGYRHRLDTFPGFDHFANFFLDEWGPGAAFLDDATVERRPARVTYRAVPAFDSETLGLVHDGAYWVQAVQTADGAEEGRVDATSLANGYAEPATESIHDVALAPAPNTREGVRWDSPSGRRTPENAVELDLDGVAGVTLYVDDAGADPGRPLTVRTESTDVATVTLKSGGGEAVVDVPAGEFETTVRLCEDGEDQTENSKTGTPANGGEPSERTRADGGSESVDDDDDGSGAFGDDGRSGPIEGDDGLLPPLL